MNSVLNITVGQEVYRPLATGCAAREGTLSATKKCPFTGPENELLALILQLCHLDHTIHRVAYDQRGHFHNGNYNGAMGLLKNGSLDIINTQWALTETRQKHFNFGYFDTQLSLAFIVLKPTISVWRNAMRIFSVYNPDLDAFLFGSAVGLLLLLAAMDVLVFQYPNPICSLLSRREIRTTYDRWTSRKIMIVTFYFLVVIGINVYRGVLLTRLFKPPPPPKPLPFEQLLGDLESNRTTIISFESSDFFRENVIHSSDRGYEKLRKAMGNNRIVVEPNKTKALEMVETGRYIIRIGEQRGLFLIQNTSRCNLVVVRLEGIASPWSTYMLSKRSPVDISAFRRCQMQMSGFREQRDTVYNRYFTKWAVRYCGTPQKADQFQVKRLGLGNLLMCFVILLIGSLFALLVLGLEFAQARRVTGKRVGPVTKSCAAQQLNSQEMETVISNLSWLLADRITQNSWKYELCQLSSPCKCCGTNISISPNNC